MTLTLDQSAHQFWTFSNHFYDNVSVRDALLALQDTFGADVNIVLYCCWRWHQGGYAVSLAELQLLERAIKPWRVAVTEPLRAARRALSLEQFGPEAIDASPIDSVAELRESVLKIEIESEWIGQQRLVNALVPRVIKNTGGTLGHTLACYLSHITSDGEDSEPSHADFLIAVIADALQVMDGQLGSAHFAGFVDGVVGGGESAQ